MKTYIGGVKPLMLGGTIIETSPRTIRRGRGPGGRGSVMERADRQACAGTSRERQRACACFRSVLGRGAQIGGWRGANCEAVLRVKPRKTLDPGWRGGEERNWPGRQRPTSVTCNQVRGGRGKRQPSGRMRFWDSSKGGGKSFKRGACACALGAWSPPF